MSSRKDSTRSVSATAERELLDEHGHEIPDPMPLQIPAGFRRPETLAEQVQRLVRTSISAQAAAQGDETFEESEDFDTGEDDDPGSPYETFFDPVLGKDLSPAEFRAHEQLYRRRYLEAQSAYFRSLDRNQVLERPPRRRSQADQDEPARGAGVSPAPARKATQEPPEAKKRD